MLPNNPCFYLISKSPRRKALLQQMGARFYVIAQEIDETLHAEENASTYVSRVAREKALAGLQLLEKTQRPRLPVLSADTTVVYQEHILGKPENKADALFMLELLSGNIHQVMTAIAIIDGDKIHERISVTDVEFNTIDKITAEKYWDTGEPRDKAGGYGIQGLGAVFVKSIKGSYSGAVGLPLWEASQLFKQLNIPYWNH